MRQAVILSLRFYKRWISPMLPSACRYYPTCSEYMLNAVAKYGVLKGVWMGLRFYAGKTPWILRVTALAPGGSPGKV